MHPEAMEHVEILVIDNNPSGKYGKFCRKLMKSVPNGRYIPFDKWKSPVVKGKVFENAQTPFVMCMDSHVMLPLGTVQRLLDFYAANPDTMDLYQGPVVYNDLTTVSTHMKPEWRGQMFGTWRTNDDGKNVDNPKFEIPMQGMGLFSCRKDAWLGFNPHFRGFGGEEGYIHEKFRQAGRTTWCLPFLRWIHRFDRPGGVPYTLTAEDKVRNYFHGWIELGLPVEDVINHFCEWRPRPHWERLLEKVRQELKSV